MKIALVYDRVNKFGGAERVLLALHEIWSDAPLYTAIYDRKKAGWSDGFEIKASYLQQLPFISSHHELFPVLTKFSFTSFNFSGYDVVLTVSSSDANGIITGPGTLHICYMLTPTRFLWSGYREYLDNPGFEFFNPFVRIAMKIITPIMRIWDFRDSSKPDFYIAISKAVAKRIKSYYRKNAVIVYPPVNTDVFKLKMQSTKTKADYFLIVSRLVPYKRIDYAVSAFNKLGWKLKIIGDGIDKERLKKTAKNNIEFISSGLTDEKLCWYYQNCLGLIFPGEEDFGIAAVEAQACGKPVVGIDRGGLREIVIPGITGELYGDADVNSLINALKVFSGKKYNAELCRKNAVRFSKKRFRAEMRTAVEHYMKIGKGKKT